MSQSRSRRNGRHDLKAIVAGVSASILAHLALFAFVGFGIPGSSDDDERDRVSVAEDWAALQIVEIAQEAPAPSQSASASPANASAGEATDAGAGAPAAAPALGGSESAAPPVLVSFTQPTSSPLLLASAVVETPASRRAASARAASYTPGGVRQAKLGWSGQDAEKASRSGYISAVLGAGPGDGHCPTPPGRGPIFGL
ncbi:MAG: hypothetical protein ABFS34_05575 [Gemmatimonadota bacterium]